MALTDEDKQWLKENFSTKEDLERVETNLLAEFHKWASPIEARMRSHREAIRALDIEGEAITDTLNEVKAKLKKLENRH